MYEKEIIGFLARYTIPKARRNYKDGDAVWQAHRDTLAGRFQLKHYAAISAEKAINPVTMDLYDHLTAHKSTDELTSSALIEFLKNTEYGKEVEYAALLKLVNMTLKYLYILQFIKADDEVLNKLPHINLANCDCPLDSNIIKTLSKKSKAISWTRIKDEAQYNAIQEEIREKCLDRFDTDSALVYDFMEYPHIKVNRKFGEA